MNNERFFDLFTHLQVYDLEQPRSSEAPLPVLVPGFTYTLHRRHEEGTGTLARLHLASLRPRTTRGPISMRSAMSPRISACMAGKR
jgi:hypothetical protein